MIQFLEQHYKGKYDFYIFSGFRQVDLKFFEIMDPQYSVQDIIRCDLCETPVPPYVLRHLSHQPMYILCRDTSF